jgi:antitoxin Phd
MVKISVSKARERLSEVVEMSQSEPVVLELYGKRAAVMVSPDQYDEMLEALEESHDVAAFDAALAEVGDNIPWEQVKSDLGWSWAPTTLNFDRRHFESFERLIARLSPEFEERLHFSRKIRDRQLRVNSEDAMVIDSELATIGLSTRSMMECC